MPRTPYVLCASLLAASPALADITPREVWDDWTAALQGGAAEVTTESVEETGEGLTIRGLSMQAGEALSMQAGEAATTRYAVEVERIDLVQTDDGTVSVEVSSGYPVVLTGTDEEGAIERTSFVVRHPDLSMVVSEESGARRHLFSAPTIEVLLEEATVDGEPLDLSGRLALSGAEGRYTTGDTGAGDSALTAERLSVSLAGTDPGGARFDLGLSMDELDSANLLQIVGPGMAELGERLREGETRDARFGSATTNFRLESEDEGETILIEGESGPGRTDLGLSSDGLRYESATEATTLSISGSAVPLPQLTFAVAESRSGFMLPFAEGDAPQPYALDLSLLGVEIDEGLWNMLDPAGILPRDPGTIVLDVSGEMILEDGPGAMVGGDPASEVETVEIDTMRLAFAGAEVVATGGLAMADGPDEAEVPVGEIALVLTGVSRLLDRLVQAGILPQDQAMGTRMMLNMFARPGAGEDELRSTIRFTEDARIFVNDQPVR